MRELKERHYITCPYKKGQPRKHIAVCRKCRHRSRCRAYQEYVQPSLPLAAVN
ncbi:MAG: hypothetical protein ACOCTS_03230 [Thermodesulfobacteriota bacterium]